MLKQKQPTMFGTTKLLGMLLRMGLFFLVYLNGTDLKSSLAQEPSLDSFINEENVSPAYFPVGGVILDTPPQHPPLDKAACLAGRGKLSKHFSCKEARFYKGATLAMVENAQRLALELEKVREESGPIIVTSWCRSPDSNKRVGGVKFSTHLTCSGMDGKTRNTVKYRRLLQNMTDLTIGYYPGHTHTDLRFNIIFVGSYG